MSYLKTIIKKAGTIIGGRRSINLIEGTNVTITVSDDSINDEVDVTINATGGGGLSDGDYGDIIVSGVGTVMTVDTGLDVTKLADGSITNTEFQYINTLSSNAQTQLDGKQPIATGTPDGTKYLRDDNTWQPVSGGSGLTQSEALKRLSFRI